MLNTHNKSELCMLSKYVTKVTKFNYLLVLPWFKMLTPKFISRHFHIKEFPVLALLYYIMLYYIILYYIILYYIILYYIILCCYVISIKVHSLPFMLSNQNPYHYSLWNFNLICINMLYHKKLSSLRVIKFVLFCS